MDTDARFCWTELSTVDAEKAARFYARLFGWDSVRQPLRARLGRQLDYSLLRMRDRNVGGMYAVAGTPRKTGSPSQWLPYVFVADAQRTTARARELGGSVLAGPFRVLDYAQMSILQDPQGVAFGTWQAIGHGGFELRNQPGVAGWFELVAEDPAAAARFYSELLGWSREDCGDRVLLGQRGTPVAGVLSRARSGSALSPQWLTFFQVDDCAANCQKVTSLQGSVIVPTFEAPGSERLAVVSDPQGARFGLLTPAPS